MNRQSNSQSLQNTVRARVKNYVANSLAPNSKAGYQSDLRHFKKSGGRIPATPEMVAQYLANLAGTYKVSTLRRRLASISHAHLAARHQNPVRSELVRRTLRGIMRVHGVAAKQARPLSLELLRAIAKPRHDVSLLRDLRDRALLLLGFAGGFRRSELVALRPVDVELTSEGAVTTIRRSKTDPHGKGRTVAIPTGRGGLCAVRTLIQWMQMLQRIDPEGAGKPIFRCIDRHGNVGSWLTAASVGSLMRQRLSLCGLETNGFTAHSLRAGLVTAAATAGVPTWAIQRHTGHRAGEGIHRYVREITPFEHNASRAAMSRASSFRVGG